MDSSYGERLKKVINVIRSRPEWEPNHREIKFTKGTVGYYDTASKDDYFDIKFGGILINHQHGGTVRIEGAIDKVVGLNVDSWLQAVESIAEDNFVVISGKRYLLTEVKNAQD